MFENFLRGLIKENVYGPERSRSRKTCDKVIEFIVNNVDRPFNLKEICEYTHFSQSYLSREFKKLNGKSIMDYVIDFKIKTAKRFLENTDLSVGDIAFKIGYYNPNDFTCIFKKRVGKSPRAYRLRFKST